MSHFSLHVLVPKLKPATQARVEAQVAALLAPFSEELNVAPYLKPCYCVGREARMAAVAAANQEVGTFDLQRERFARQYPELARVDRFARDADRDSIEKADELWKKEFVEPREAAEKRALEAHPQKAATDPDCEECEGKGTNETQYNPKSKWDWYSIGGRWNGGLRGVDPVDNPKNWKVCFLCDGTGKRPDMTVKDGCNGCQGTGKELKWPSDQEDAGNVLPLGEFLPRLAKDTVPFALLTPEGEWIERGEMGWWACVSNEKNRDSWLEEVRTVYAKYPDSVLVLVDCHI